MARHFQYRVEVFFNEITLNGHWEKETIMLYILNFGKGVAHMSIHTYGVSMHQILKLKLRT